MKPGLKEGLPLRLEKLYREIEELLMEDVVRRIQKTGKITSTADYQLNRKMLLGSTSEDIEKEIQKRTGKAQAEMYEMYDKVINREYVRNKDIYEQVNANFIPWEENTQLQQLSLALIEQSKNELKNLTNSMGFAINMGGNLVFTPMSEYYQKYLDTELLSIVTGSIDYNTVLRKCVTQMTNSGIRVVDYASGHSNRIDVAARRAVMTGISQLSGKISEYNAERLGTDYYEVAWHEGARNTGIGFYNHQSWQGKVYTMQQLKDVCGLGQGGGLEGWNCYHEKYPFIPGISERNWSDEWLENMNRRENAPKQYGGRAYDAYGARQKQRQMETAMRAQREKVRLLQSGGADKDVILNEKIKYQGQLDEYKRFSDKMDLKQQRQRIYIDLKGRVAPDTRKSRKVASKLEVMYNKGNLLENIKEYEKDLRGLSTYRKTVPHAELWHYRLNKSLHEKNLILPKAYVIPADRKKAYILEHVEYKRDPSHIMKRMRERNITDDQVQLYVDTAIFALLHYNGTRLGYYSPEGVTILTKTNSYEEIEWIAKTAWTKHDYDETTEEIIKEAKKYAGL